MNCLLGLIAMSTIALGLDSSMAIAQAEFGVLGSTPPVPANIEVPAGHSLFFKAHAEGTQNYLCLPTASSVAWTFVAPQATLFHTYTRKTPAAHDPLSQRKPGRDRPASPDLAALV